MNRMERQRAYVEELKRSPNRIDQDEAIRREALLNQIIAERLRIDSLVKHAGPGSHPGTGTDQSVHGGGASATATDRPRTGRSAVDYFDVADQMMSFGPSYVDIENLHVETLGTWQEQTDQLEALRIFLDTPRGNAIADAAGPLKVRFVDGGEGPAWANKQLLGQYWDGDKMVLIYTGDEMNPRSPEAMAETLAHEFGHAVDYNWGNVSYSTLNVLRDPLASGILNADKGEDWPTPVDQVANTLANWVGWHTNVAEGRRKLGGADPVYPFSQRINDLWAYPSETAGGRGEFGQDFRREFFAQAVEHYWIDPKILRDTVRQHNKHARAWAEYLYGPLGATDENGNWFRTPLYEVDENVLVDFVEKALKIKTVAKSSSFTDENWIKVPAHMIVEGWSPTEAQTLLRKLVKHYGPGPHPGTGTDQTIHGSRLLAPATGSGFLHRKPISKEITNADGSPWTPSAMVKGKLHLNHPSGIKDITAKLKAQVKKMRANLRKYGLVSTDAALDRNLRRLLDSAAARYKDHPKLINEDRFYDRWHESLYELSEETGIEFSRIIAGASAISPGLRAERNIVFIHDLARMVAMEDEIIYTGPAKMALADHLRATADDILHPIWQKKFHKIPPGVQEGDPRPAPEPGSARHQTGTELLEAAELLTESKSVSLGELSPLPAAHAAQTYRKAHGQMGPILGKPIYDPMLDAPIGFDIAKTYGYYADSISVLRGDTEVLDSLGDIKTRSFHNNILDPTNISGRGDVTVDYHTINFTTFSLGAEENTTITSSTGLEGVKLGTRPLMADAIRRMAVEYADVFPDGHVPARIQEIAWAEWRRGLTTKGRFSWTSYTGKKYTNLPYSGLGQYRREEQERGRT